MNKSELGKIVVLVVLFSAAIVETTVWIANISFTPHFYIVLIYIHVLGSILLLHLVAQFFYNRG